MLAAACARCACSWVEMRRGPFGGLRLAGLGLVDGRDGRVEMRREPFAELRQRFGPGDSGERQSGGKKASNLPGMGLAKCRTPNSIITRSKVAAATESASASAS